MRACLKALLVGGMLMMSCLAVADDAVPAKQDTLEDRVKPVGDLCMAGDDCAAAPVAVSADVATAARTVEDIYKGKCSTCHATGVANAPKFGDKAAWEPRIAKGMETLYGSAVNGFNGMPAKGLCMDCSEDEIKATVDYMVNAAK